MGSNLLKNLGTLRLAVRDAQIKKEQEEQRRLAEEKAKFEKDHPKLDNLADKRLY